MRRFGLVCLLLLCASAVSAQNLRTWVSNSGVDTGTTCAVTAPCRTISYALAVTTSGGDLVVLDSGGFGSSLTINKSVNIFAPDGVYAVITNSSANNSVLYVNAGVNDIIRIKGLNLLSTDKTQGTGLNVGQCKRTEVTNMQISNVGYGVYVGVDTRLTLDHVTIANTTTGIWSIGSNTAAQAYPNNHLGPFLRVLVTNSVIRGATTGVKLDAGSFTMGSDSLISFCTQDPYLIAAIVPSCSSISNNGQMNHYTGIYNATCMCYLNDLRNGMNQTGDCEY